MAYASRPSAVGRGTLAFLYGLCEVEELPGSYLVEVFGALNMSASGARSYLARAVADGRLVSHRRGRQTAYALNGTFLRRYRTIEQRFISRPDWEGRFHIVIYDIPETRRSERDALVAWLRGRGCTAHESDANFVLFGPFEDRDAVFAALLERGVLIRVVGPEGYLRVSIGTPDEMEAFRSALDGVLAGTRPRAPRAAAERP